MFGSTEKLYSREKCNIDVSSSVGWRFYTLFFILFLYSLEVFLLPYISVLEDVDPHIFHFQMHTHECRKECLIRGMELLMRRLPVRRSKSKSRHSPCSMCEQEYCFSLKCGYTESCASSELVVMWQTEPSSFIKIGQASQVWVSLTLSYGDTGTELYGVVFNFMLPVLKI